MDVKRTRSMTTDPEIESLRYIADHFRWNNRVGWISPDGHVSGTETFYHLQFFLSNPEACPAAYAVLADKWEEFEYEAQEDYRDGTRRWHEWVEIPMDVEEELAMEARNVAYREGWGRIGTYGGDKFELECFEEHRARLSRRTRKLAEMLGRELVVTVREPYEPQAPSV